MRFLKALGLLGSCVAAASKYDEPIRPQVHYSPPYGFMNDPNGMVYTNGLYHLFYQWNPNDTVAGTPQWGHATSEDLVHWNNHGVAIASATKDEGVFSGSAVLDVNNTSGFFDDSVKPNDRVVAIFTSNTPEKQTQDIAYSKDGGFNFTRYSENPVIDINSTQFRDPKVFFHEDTGKWVMVVAKSFDFEIAFYTSCDLKNWEEVSTFSGGLYGYQYEVPDLVKLRVEGTSEYKWVLFVSINPGMPLGGSGTQYFIGDFDGETFTPDDHAVRMADFGKDWYAAQTWSNTGDDVLGLAWASNWQYTGEVPTKQWRSCMSVARKMGLKKNVKYNPGYTGYSLTQEPLVDKKLRDESCHGKAPLSLESETGAFEFRINATQNDGVSDKSSVRIKVSNSTGHLTTLGLRPDFHFFIDRSDQFEHPLYNEKISVYAQPDNDEKPVYDIHGIVDRGLIEIFINNGTVAFTNTVFVADADKIQIEADDGYTVNGEIYSLKSTW
jgi:beta-fructofuranosidase